ncbi:hypothetical protein HF086_000212 [Spodoptera exigua]|uniref:Uncharacterized protein n=1 Tax=Spodoptera exigua TaxID=7107 RepID=A0A922S7Z6_SPOEX|nr:hypothetical protein HF086_000212 [Spodoptera exigua]
MPRTSAVIDIGSSSITLLASQKLYDISQVNGGYQGEFIMQSKSPSNKEQSPLSLKYETLGDGVFRWKCIKLYIYLSITYASTAYNFDVFSKVCENGT